MIYSNSKVYNNYKNINFNLFFSYKIEKIEKLKKCKKVKKSLHQIKFLFQLFILNFILINNKMAEKSSKGASIPFKGDMISSSFNPVYK